MGSRWDMAMGQYTLIMTLYLMGWDEVRGLAIER